MKQLLFILASITLLSAACTIPANTSPLPKEKNEQAAATPEMSPKDEMVTEDEFDSKQWRLEGKNIIGNTTGKLRGYYQNNKISILNTDKDIQITFPGDIENLHLLDALNIESFTYNDITISTELRYPTSNYEVDSVIFSCDNRLFKGLEGEPQIYERCETNKRDRISQFMFTGISGIGFGTGGDYDVLWKKVYAIKTPYNTLFIIHPLEQDGYPVSVAATLPSATPGQKSQLQKQATKEYLDSLLSRPDNQTTLKEFDDLVNELQVVQ